MDLISPITAKPTFVIRGETLRTSIVDVVWCDTQKLADTVEELEDDDVGSNHRMAVYRGHGAELANQQTQVYERWRLARVKDPDRMEKYPYEFLSQLESWHSSHEMSDILLSLNKEELEKCYEMLIETVKSTALS